MKLSLPRTCACLVVLIGTVPLTAWMQPARAQTPQTGDIRLTQPPEGPEQGGDRFAIGIGAAYMPAHLGSDEYRFQPLPAIDIQRGPFFANFQNGIGLHVINNERISVGVGVLPSDNYRVQDVPDGVGKLNMGVGVRGFVTLRFAGLEATVGAMQIVASGTEGFIADAQLSYPIMISQRLMIAPSVQTRWGDRQNNNRYFGITPTQTAASGLPEFSTGSGFIDAQAQLNVMYRLTDRIGVGVIGGMSTLMGDVRNSPIVEERTRPFGIFFVSYDLGGR